MIWIYRAMLQNTGVGDDDVDWTEFRCRIINCRSQSVGISHISLKGHYALIECLNLFYRQREIVGSGHAVRNRLDLTADVDRDDGSTLLRQADRMTAPLPTRSTGDQSNFAFELSHTSRFLC